MIAIMPDPVQTHMALQFDRGIEAIQLAAESMDYVIDRHWLPWKYPIAGAREPENLSTPERFLEPGLLTFRWDGPAQRAPAAVLYVFLVGDVATAGINGVQFGKALEYVQQVCKGEDCGRQIHILGPTFSGSLDSLRRLTSSRKDLRFTAYSGTVSSICAVEKQGLSSGPESCPNKQVSASPLSNLHFRSLVYGTESALEMFIELLRKREGKLHCGDRPDIAIFSEAATTYGHTPRDVLRQYPGTQKSGTAPSVHSDEDCRVNFSYPREISSLRNAYIKPDQGSASAQPDVTGAPVYLPFNLADRQVNSSDEPEDFSGAQGPLSKEAVLMSFASELRRDHFKYIGITGSNVLDVLFLASFLRKTCPDARLFVLNSDLLFERELDNAPYIGTLTLTTYPLIIDNLDWTKLNGASGSANPAGADILTRMPFADQYEEGQYNAGLLTLGKLFPELPAAELYEFRNPFGNRPGHFNPDCSQLPLWLTTVGNGGYWPVEILAGSKNEPSSSSCKDMEAAAHPTPAKLEDADFSPAWKATLTVLCALSALHVLLLVTASPLRTRVHDFSLANPAPDQRFIFINIASCTLAVALLMLLVPLFRYGDVGRYLTFIEYIGTGIALSLLLSCVALTRHFLYIASNQAVFGQTIGASMRVGLLGLTTGVWLAGAAGTYFWWRLLNDEASSHYGFFFAFRSVHLATGVSPITPMLPLFAALYSWAMLEVWRLRFDDQARPKLHSLNGSAKAVNENLVAKSVNRYFLNAKYLIAMTLAFVVWLFFLQPQHPFEIFEHQTFGIIYEVVFCLVVLQMLTSGFRLAWIWSELKRLLAELDQSRARLAFGRLKEYSWSPIWQSGVPEIEWTNITRSLEIMQEIKSCAKDLPDDLRKSIDQASTCVQEVKENEEKCPQGIVWPSQSLEDFHRLNVSHFRLEEQMAVLLETVTRHLENIWNTKCYSYTEERGGEEKAVIVNCQPEKPSAEVSEMFRMEKFLALRYVAFIRGVLSHMRRLIIRLTVLFSLALLSLNIYSFEPHQSLIWSFIAIFVLIGVTVIVVLMQVHRDHILSRVTGTKPNELGLDFYLRLAVFGAAPLLTLLATQFPSIGRYLLSWFQPGLEALK